MARSTHAAIGIAHRLGIKSTEPVILHHSQHTSIRLHPLDIVARVARIENSATNAKIRRELAVTRHLVQKQAPIVLPSTQFPAGPHHYDEFAVTLWQFVDRVATNPSDAQHIAQAATALRKVHLALADFPGELPRFTTKIDECLALLKDSSALVAISAGDRAFLLMAYNRIMASLEALPQKLAPIHGDAHLGNVFITANGALWNDFEDASLGPREWDIGLIPDSGLPAFEPTNRKLLAVLRDLRSLCVSVWCWDKYHIAEKQEAAHYHLGYLRQRIA